VCSLPPQKAVTVSVIVGSPSSSWFCSQVSGFVQRTGVEHDAYCGSSQITILFVTCIYGANHFVQTWMQMLVWP
jgi:hypothetical protein